MMDWAWHHPRAVWHPPLKVRRLSSNASRPELDFVKGVNSHPGYALKSAVDCVVPPARARAKERTRSEMDVPLDLDLLMPDGILPRLEKGTSLPAAVSVYLSNTRSYMQECIRDMKIRVYNFSSESLTIRRGDSIGHLVLEDTTQMMEPYPVLLDVVVDSDL